MRLEGFDGSRLFGLGDELIGVAAASRRESDDFSKLGELLLDLQFSCSD